MQLLGFSGPAGSGKDTAGHLLVQNYGFERISFARPLYSALEAMGFGWPTTQDEKERVIPEIGKSWRQLAQTLGTEWGRQLVHPDLWVLLALRDLKPGGRYVITDVRFENEASCIRRAKGKVVHIRGRGHAMTLETVHHASESLLELQAQDLCVLNTGTLEDFGQQVADLSYDV